MGVLGVFTNVITLLSLSDLGVISAITYQLYKPISENDLPKIKFLIKKFDNYYTRISLVVLIIGLIIMIPMPYLLKDTTISINKLRFFFALQLLTTLSGYLFASRKTLLFVYEQHYITVFFETVSNFIFSIIKIFIIFFTKDYLLFLLVNIFQTIFSSLFIYFYSKHEFKFLEDKSIESNQYIIPIYKDMKNMTISSIAGFIYSSTDNLIISSLIGISSVGLLSNYKLIPQILFDVVSNVLKPVQASVGSLVNEKDSESIQLDTFQIYTFIRFLIANYICISIILFTDDFIVLWFGTQYRLLELTTWLISIDLFISIIQGSIINFNNAKGFFKQDRDILIVGAIINLFASLLLVFCFGINGVLLGTVIAQVYHWVSRIIMINKELFNDFKNHLLTSIQYLLFNICLTITLLVLKKSFIQILNIFQLFLWAFTLTIVINLFTLIAFRKKSELKKLTLIFKSLIKV